MLYSLFVSVLIVGLVPDEDVEPLMTGMRHEECQALAVVMHEQAMAENINVVASCRAEG